MNERQQNIAVGLTSILGMGGLAFMLLLFGYVPDFFNGKYGIRVELATAAGLHAGGIVTYRGIEVGKVESVRLGGPGVIADLLIDEPFHLPANVSAVLEGSVFGTSATLALQADPWPDADGPIRYLPADGSAIIQGSSVSASQTIAQLGDQIARLSDEWVQVGQNINALIEPRGVESVDGGDAVGNASTVMARLDQRLAEMQAVLAGINRYVNDEPLWADVRATASAARELSSRLPGDVAALRARYVALADDVSKAVASLNETLDATRRPDGTIGKMITDPALYDNMNDTFLRLQKAIDEMRLLVEKWKDEGLPVKF